jgi:hypothetical protein
LWRILKGLLKLPEFTASRIRDAIVAAPQQSFELLVHLYKHEKEGIVAELPDVFADLLADIEQFRALIKDGTLEKPMWVPLVKIGDIANARCVRFGGSMPHDPIAGYPLCPVCHVPVTHIMTMYVGLLPPEVQAFFPEDERETVLVVGYCEHCFLEVPVQVFHGSEIDNLVFSANHTNHGRPFNEPRVVVGWMEGRSRPDGEGILELALEGMKYESVTVWNELFEKNLMKSQVTYAGGFPRYIQGSERPKATSKLLFEMADSEASTGMWGDCGSAQLWMETGGDYGKFQVTWACS